MIPDSLDPRINFARASGATYTDASGVIQTAATNAPRWDYDPVTHALRGLLIEEQRTNLALRSGDFSNAAWINSGGLTVTGNNAVSPDGTTTAARIAIPATSGAGSVNVLLQPFSPVNAVHSAGIWLRGSVGGEQTYLMVQDGTNYSRVRVTLTTAWQRFSLVTTAFAAGQWYYQIGTDLRDGTQTSTPAQTIYAWGAQVEQGAFPTSYIPTTSAAVTRAADVATISPANMSPWFASPGGSWFAEFIDLNPPSALTPRVVAYPVPGNIYTIAGGTGLTAFEYDGVGAVTTPNAFSPNTIARIASTWATGAAKICLNGGTVVTSATLTGGYAGFASAGVQFMANSTLGDGMTGYIRRVQYSPLIWSDAVMQQVTT